MKKMEIDGREVRANDQVPAGFQVMFFKGKIVGSGVIGSAPKNMAQFDSIELHSTDYALLERSHARQKERGER